MTAVRAIAPCTYLHPELGPVEVKVVSRSRSIRAGWRKGHIVVTVPPHLPAQDYERIFSGMAPRLLEAKPRPKFMIGETLELPMVTFRFHSQSSRPGRAFMLREGERGIGVYLCPTLDLTDISIQAEVSSLMLRGVQVFRQSLIERVEQVVRATGAPMPRIIRLSHGKRTLGSCSTQNHVSLSSMLFFLPADLMDFVISHELAHQTHHDHSPQFHALLDSYCGGREKEYVRRLRNYDWPIMR